ncbi:hypothetical protein M9H77_22292 [Catharanthus roseus]|uniref:Uncharacterized protein n=1 Tax=Catharanthus roseus TaxID=4058 RepID=A0ACC0AS42_CATRO|nr:hypothetical protein M9H77_22292 [Catharanthus roseus]
MSLLKKGASHGYAPRSLTCCVCNGPVMKSSQSSSIQVFACGHAMHVNCEPQESESSFGGSSSGCPICVPRKKRHRSVGNPMLVEKRLVGKASSRSNKSLGTLPLHAPPDVDSFENMYGSHPLPRFELLSILQKDQRSIQIDNMPQLRLAPPAVYHDKVKKGTDLMTGESSSSSSKAEKSSRSRLLQDVKGKGSSIRFPLRPNIFGFTDFSSFRKIIGRLGQPFSSEEVMCILKQRWKVGKLLSAQTQTPGLLLCMIVKSAFVEIRLITDDIIVTFEKLSILQVLEPITSLLDIPNRGGHRIYLDLSCLPGK